MTSLDTAAELGTQTTEELEPPDALAFVVNLRGGTPVADWSEALQKVTAAAIETGKGGSTSLTLTVKPHKKLPGVVTVEAAVKSKVPEHDVEPSVFFVDHNGLLTRDHPDQRRFPAAVVPGGEA
jgi:hypothetical protein